jgi:L-histidine Nalpha-methyltransferase / hercynylcysteine S-oxide synthase
VRVSYWFLESLISCSSDHGVPSATTFGGEQGDRGSNGGVWEWTSTAFDVHEGFIGTSIFPGYSSDFFDNKHHVVVRA